MDRRVFVTVVGGGILAVPFVAEAQQAGKVLQIGVLSKGFPPPVGPGDHLAADLGSLGWVEGQNISILRRYTERRDDRLPDLAAELVRRKVDLIVVIGTACTLAARQATATIPIVMLLVLDPVHSGFVASLAHPGGNVTGVTLMGPATAGKELQLLREIAPRISRVAYIWDLTNPGQVLQKREADAAALALGIKVRHIGVRTDSDLDNALPLLLKERTEAVDVYGPPVSDSAIQRFAEFALKNRLLTVTPVPNFMHLGLLMSWGPSLDEQWQRAAYYVDRILKGAKPANLPIEQPTKFELVINLKTAKTLALTIPQTLLLRANQIIE